MWCLFFYIISWVRIISVFLDKVNVKFTGLSPNLGLKLNGILHSLEAKLIRQYKYSLKRPRKVLWCHISRPCNNSKSSFRRWFEKRAEKCPQQIQAIGSRKRPEGCNWSIFCFWFDFFSYGHVWVLVWVYLFVWLNEIFVMLITTNT